MLLRRLLPTGEGWAIPDHQSGPYRVVKRSATIGGATTTYAYDGDGKRASKTVGGTTTSYVQLREVGVERMGEQGRSDGGKLRRLAELRYSSPSSARSPRT
ncbi:MAG: hypothetical protein HYY04_06475 [Chloroflexi bacterium]|nr:hypothetical protein [Chloroflexota bacterium]